MTTPTASAPIIIKHRFTCAVLFEGESGMSMRETLEKATAAKTDLSGADLRGADLSGAYLSGADLRGADLRGADLSGAYLSGAYLSGAYLSGADLRGADLSGAYLSGAYLSGADLSGAYLRGAYLRGKKLIGDRPFITIGPIGSRSDYLKAWLTDSGVMIGTGCFFGTREMFEINLAVEHENNEYAHEYRAALVLIDKHAELWTPAAEVHANEADEVAA